MTCEQDAINAMEEGLKQSKSKKYTMDEATNNRFSNALSFYNAKILIP